MKTTKHQIVGTRVTVYTAWEPYNNHSTFTHIDGIRFGRVGTAPIPEHLDKLKPMSDERYIQVKAWIEGQYRRAYAIITNAHPEASDGCQSMGEIEVVS